MRVVYVCLMLLFIQQYYCYANHRTLLDELEEHFDRATASKYEELITNGGLEEKTYVTYQTLRTAGVQSVHDQLLIMQLLRSEQVEKSPLPERLIFSVNTGRSGSRYLASMLDSCENVVGEHEPRPGPSGSRNMMHTTLADTFEERRTLKNTAIRRSMNTPQATSKKATVYAETNPNFKVWIWDVVIDEFGRNEGKRIDIMIVRKYIPALVKSIYELGWFQHANRGENWLPTANSVNSLIEPLAPDHELDAYDKIISSIINTEAVAQYMMNRFGSSHEIEYLPNVIFHEYRSEELFDGHRMLQVLRQDLNLQPTGKTEHLAGVKIDKYRVGEDHSGKLRNDAHIKHTTIEECEERVDDYIRKCRERHIQLPDLPHLKKYPGFRY